MTLCNTMSNDAESMNKSGMCMLIKQFDPKHAVEAGTYIVSERYPVRELRNRVVKAYKFSETTTRLYLHCPDMPHAYMWINSDHLEKVEKQEKIVNEPEVFTKKEIETRADEMLDAAMKMVMPFVKAVGARTMLYSLPATLHYMIRKQTGKSESATLSGYSHLTQKAIDMQDMLAGLGVDEALYILLMLTDQVADTVLKHNAVGQLTNEREGAKS